MSNQRKCMYCGKGGDLRPYGPGGGLVCFQCAMATPEREAEAERQFAKVLGGGDVMLTDAGPVPLKRGRA